MPDSCHPSSSAPAAPVLPRRTADPTTTFITQLCRRVPVRRPLVVAGDRTRGTRRSSRWSRPRRTSTPASCPRCSTGVRRLEREPARASGGARRRSARCTRSRRRCSSARWSTKLRFGRGSPAAKNSRPSAPVAGVGDVDVAAAQQVLAARTGVADRRDELAGSVRCTLTFHMCSRGLSRSHCTGRIELPTPRSNGGFGNVGLAMTNRGVAGGFVTVTIRFCWLLVLKYSP